MCHKSCLDFGKRSIKGEAVAGKKILEVGSRNVNGTLRSFYEKHNPASYLGVDMVAGEGVDEVCDVQDLVTRFGPESFDYVVSTEMLEHVVDWKVAIHNLKGVLKPGGWLLLTTRSRPFYYHGYPHDYWRFDVEDMKRIFADMSCRVEKDLEIAGVFVLAYKPISFLESDLTPITVYAMPQPSV